MTKRLNVSGIDSVIGRLSVVGTVRVNRRLNVSGRLSAFQRLSVSRRLSMSGTVSVSGRLRIGGRLRWPAGRARVPMDHSGANLDAVEADNDRYSGQVPGWLTLTTSACVYSPQVPVY